MSQSQPTRDQTVAVATLEMNRERRIPYGALIWANGRRVSFAGWAEFGAVIEDWRTWTRSSASHRERPGHETGQRGTHV